MKHHNLARREERKGKIREEVFPRRFAPRTTRIFRGVSEEKPRDYQDPSRLDDSGKVTRSRFLLEGIYETFAIISEGGYKPPVHEFVSGFDGLGRPIASYRNYREPLFQESEPLSKQSIAVKREKALKFLRGLVSDKKTLEEGAGVALDTLFTQAERHYTNLQETLGSVRAKTRDTEEIRQGFVELRTLLEQVKFAPYLQKLKEEHDKQIEASRRSSFRGSSSWLDRAADNY